MKIWNKQEEKEELQRLDDRKRFSTSKGFFLILLPDNPIDDDLKILESKFGIHPISFQDYHFNSKPNIEDYGDYLFITCFAFEYSNISKRFSKTKQGVCIGENFVILISGENSRCVQEIFENG